jgi:hypothetical protein
MQASQYHSHQYQQQQDYYDFQANAMASLKLRRIINFNNRLHAELVRTRIPASDACLS